MTAGRSASAAVLGAAYEDVCVMGLPRIASHSWAGLLHESTARPSRWTPDPCGAHAHLLWQGFIAPIAFLVSLFNHNVGIYQVHNNGAWYDFGYIVGLTIFFSGGTAGARTRPRASKGARP